MAVIEIEETMKRASKFILAAKIAVTMKVCKDIRREETYSIAHFRNEKKGVRLGESVPERIRTYAFFFLQRLRDFLGRGSVS